jgi:hypothetical protein
VSALEAARQKALQREQELEIREQWIANILAETGQREGSDTHTQPRGARLDGKGSAHMEKENCEGLEYTAMTFEKDEDVQMGSLVQKKIARTAQRSARTVGTDTGSRVDAGAGDGVCACVCVCVSSD